jgi:hypothetical protein
MLTKEETTSIKASLIIAITHTKRQFYIYTVYILWLVDLLLGNDREISINKTAISE